MEGEVVDFQVQPLADTIFSSNESYETNQKLSKVTWTGLLTACAVGKELVT